MAVTIRNWSDFPAPIGDVATQALDLTLQGRSSLAALVENLSTAFSLYPPATDRKTLVFVEDAGSDVLRLDGSFKDSSGHVDVFRYYDGFIRDGSVPTSGEYYKLSGGDANFDQSAGFTDFFNRVEFADYAEGYSAVLLGRFFVATGEGRFTSADLRLDDGSGYLLRGDIGFSMSDGGSFSGRVRGLDVYGEGGERVATARGLNIDAADFGDGPGTFAEDVIFDGSDNVTLGNGGVYFRAWGGGDRVRGGTGDDSIDGGDGHDVLTGGAGDDVFLFSATGPVLETYATDLVTDFRRASDVLDFDTDVFSSLADPDYYDEDTGDFLFSAAEADGVLTYVQGVIYYDADGSSGDGGAVAIVKLAGNPALTDANFVAEPFSGP